MKQLKTERTRRGIRGEREKERECFVERKSYRRETAKLTLFLLGLGTVKY
jgi:hypothetical protein